MYSLKIIFSKHKIFSFSYLFTMILSTLQSVFVTVFLPGIVLNYLLNDKGILVPLILLGVSGLLAILVQIVDKTCQDYIYPATNKRFRSYIEKEIFKAASKIELEKYDDPEFYNQYTWALDGVDRRLTNISVGLTDIITAIISIFTVSFYIFTIDPLILLFVVFALLVYSLTSIIIIRIRIRNNEKLKIISREESYYVRVLYLQQYKKELRVFDFSRLIFNKIKDLYKRFCVQVDRFVRKVFPFNLLSNINSSLFIGLGVIIFGVYRITVTKSLEIDKLVILTSGAMSIYIVLSSLLNGFTDIFQEGVYIGKYRSFIEREDTLKTGEKSIDELIKNEFKLTFNQVNFSYDKERNVINNFNIEIHKGQKIAIVGENGSGKSTFIKLLMRFYDTKDGEILLNGENIKQFDIKEYRDLFCPVFQDYKIIEMSIAENILYRAVASEEDEDIVIKALKESQLWDDVKNFPKGIHTTIGREFDNEGKILSGGQMQKLAVARALAKDAKIIVLDEINSNLDPISENKLFNSLINYTHDKTVIYITHKLSTIKDADIIYYIENGSVIEYGSHEELYYKKGKYYNNFVLQEKQFIIEGK